MNVWKVSTDRHIEAHDATSAIDIAFEGNGRNDIEEYFTDKTVAYARFNELAAGLRAPQDLSRGLAWYEVAIIDEAINCDDITDLEEAYNSGNSVGGDAAIGK